MALLLIEPSRDVWEPGEHNGTFRGNNLAFVAAEAALGYWEDRAFQDDLAQKIDILDDRLEAIAARWPEHVAGLRGRGFMRGLVLQGPGTAALVSQQLFARDVLAETCGPDDEVLKLLPPLTIPIGPLTQALDTIEDVIAGLGSVELAAAR